MATNQSTTLRLRSFWFQIHKWLGISLAILIIPISLTGAALVWHDWLDESLNPARHAVGKPVLTPGAYASAAARELAPGERLLSITYPKNGGAILVAAARPSAKGETRPVRTQLWLDPANGRLLDRAASDKGLIRVMHGLHGSLMVPGVGRQIVGWIGVAMLLSSLTGIWLWWPLQGSWTKGLRWRRRDSLNDNLHHLTGFWIAIPLAMLSFTGAWISFPAFFAQLSGASAPPPRQAPAPPLGQPNLSPDLAVQLASPHAAGALASIGWPTEKTPAWKIGYVRSGGSNAEAEVDDVTKEVKPPSPPKPETLARTMRRWHDGTGMGPAWQIIIFIGGIIPALLAVTGILMWLRTRKWRSKLDRKRRSRAPAAAE